MLLKHYFDVSQAEDIDTFRRRLINMAGALDFPLITSVLVVDAQDRLVGAINSNDLMRAKVI